MDTTKAFQKVGVFASNGNVYLYRAKKNIPEFQISSNGFDFLPLKLPPDFKTISNPKIKIPATLKKSLKNSSFKIGNLLKVDKGSLLLFFEFPQDKKFYLLQEALLDKKNPSRVILQGRTLWKQDGFIDNKQVRPVGVVKLENKLISYWELAGGEMFAIAHPFHFAKKSPLAAKINLPFLKKFKENPILKPIFAHYWESKAVFNPTALYEDGKVYIVYRAVGDNDTSVLGCAVSSDGVNIDERLAEPIYHPREAFESNSDGFRPNSFLYMSGGGGCGGCEDPRITKIGDTLYMTYVAHDGRTAPRAAITSISVEDFLNRRWKNWKKPVLISPPGIVDKSAVVLPGKVKGKYCIFHRIFPNILIDFVDSLDFDGKTFLKGEYSIPPRYDSWDSRKVGVGPAPIKTDDGWLVIYHSVDDRDPYRYKIGAMLLDHDNPTRVLFRSKKPILEPSESYENEGHKAGVVYPCGGVKIDDRLIVYYGGADSYVCAGVAYLPKFIADLKETGSAKLNAYC